MVSLLWQLEITSLDQNPVWGLGWRVQGLGLRVQGSGLRVLCLGFRVGLSRALWLRV